MKLQLLSLFQETLKSIKSTETKKIDLATKNFEKKKTYLKKQLNFKIMQIDLNFQTVFFNTNIK